MLYCSREIFTTSNLLRHFAFLKDQLSVVLSYIVVLHWSFYLDTVTYVLMINYHVKEARATKVLCCIVVVKSLPLFTSK